jgi:hypothetical protein
MSESVNVRVSMSESLSQSLYVIVSISEYICHSLYVNVSMSESLLLLNLTPVTSYDHKFVLASLCDLYFLQHL